MRTVLCALGALLAFGVSGCFPDSVSGSARGRDIRADSPESPESGTSAESLIWVDDLPREPPPLFWTWQPALGQAASQSRVIRMVRARVERISPAECADVVCDEILRRKLRPGEVCIMLHNFGVGDGDPSGQRFPREAPALFRHWCDGVAHPVAQDERSHCERIGPLAAPEWWHTPWMSHGIRECSTWMRAFARQYRMRQAVDSGIPDPTRFHFDSERHVMPQFGANTAPPVFNAMLRDDRFGTESIPGHGGRTLEALYDAAGRPECDPDRPFTAPANRDWVRWYAGVCQTAADGAMNEAAYVVIRETWPNCLSSNYGTSQHADGGGSPPRVERGQRHDWFTWTSRGSGDLQAPDLYWTDPEHDLPGENAQSASVRRAGERMLAYTGSAGRAGTVTPWIQPVGSRVSRFDRESTVTRAMFSDMLAMLRMFGVSEYILWSDESTQVDRHWDDTLRAIVAAYAARLHAVSVVHGTPTLGTASAARYAGFDPLVVNAVPTGEDGAAAFAARVDMEFRTTLPAGAAVPLRLVMLGWTDRTRAELRVRVGDRVVPVPRIDPENRTLDHIVRFVDLGSATAARDDAGRIRVSVEAVSPVPCAMILDGALLFARP